MIHTCHQGPLRAQKGLTRHSLGGRGKLSRVFAAIDFYFQVSHEPGLSGPYRRLCYDSLREKKLTRR